MMNDKRLHWQEAPAAERERICTFYSRYLEQSEGIVTTANELNSAWFGNWFDVIKYTFGPDCYYMQQWATNHAA